MADDNEGPSAEDLANSKEAGRSGGGLFTGSSPEELNAEAEGKAEAAQTEAAERTADAAERTADAAEESDD